MSYKQYIFCLETTKQANTDWLYIRKVIDYLNKDKHSFDRYKPLYMAGKGNYNSKSFVRQLKEAINMFSGESIVIYCMDLDDYHTNLETKKFVDNVEKYCNDNNYKFVYFSRDIEEVFWKKRINREKKKQFAAKFNRDVDISNDLLKRLNSETKKLENSNLLIKIMEKTK